MEVDDAGKLLRAVLHASRIVVTLRDLTPANDDWLLDYVDMLPLIDNLEPHLFDAVATALAALLLVHQNSVENAWFTTTRKKRAKKKKKKTKKKKKSRSRHNDDDSDEEDGDVADPGDDDDDENADSSSLSRAEREAMDATISQSLVTPLINLGNDETVSLERLLSNHTLFVPHLQPILFEAPHARQRQHVGLDYSLLLLVQTCVPVAETTVMLEKCRGKMLAMRVQSAEKLGFGNPAELRCRIMLLAWGERYKSCNSRGYRALRKLFRTLNSTHSGDGVSFEFFSIDQMQHDVTRDQKDQFTVLGDKNVDADEKARLRTIKTFEMRRLERSDPQAAVRDFRVGQRVRVRREHIHSGGQSFEYLRVVDSDI